MSWLSKIQSKTRAEKIRLIWIIAGMTVAILLAVWILVGRIYNRGDDKLELFKDFDQIIQDAKQNKPDFSPPKN